MQMDIDLLKVNFSWVVYKIFSEAQLYFYVPKYLVINFKFRCC